MSTKPNLMKSAMVRLESNREFFAYFLKTYRETEAVSEAQLINLLQCSPENYYKLALCKAPDVEAPDYLLRIKTICEYTGISLGELNTVIKRVNTVIKFAGRTATDVAMAARDKQKTDDNSDK